MSEGGPVDYANLETQAAACEPGTEPNNVAPTHEWEPSFESDAAKLKAQLVELHLVTPEEWDEASRRVSNPKDGLLILLALTDMRSTDESCSGTNLGILTPFQLEQIRCGCAQTLVAGRYILLDRLGGGGMGEVFLARDTNLPQLVAIKIIQPDYKGANQSDAVARFRREANLLTRLRQARFPIVYEFGRRIDGSQFIAMEYVHGRTLKQVVDQAPHQRIEGHKAVSYALATAEALAFAHRNDVIHRDIKPQNLMVTDSGDLKVLDLGIAKLTDAVNGPKTQSSLKTMANAAMGTNGFVPPEQLQNARDVTPAADVFSLGVTLYYLLTGKLPFSIETMGHYLSDVFSTTRPSPRKVRVEIPARLDAIVRSMLAPEPVDRPKTMDEIAALLRPFAHPPAWEKRSLMTLVTGLLVAVLVAGTAVYFISHAWNRPNGKREDNPVLVENTSRIPTENSSEAPGSMSARLLTKARNALRAGNDREAWALFDSAARDLTAKLPNEEALWIEAMMGRAQASYRANKVAEAKADIAELLKYPQPPADAFQLQATILASEGNLVDAAKAMDTALQRADAHTLERTQVALAIYSDLVKFLLDDKQLDKAETAFRRLLELDSTNADKTRATFGEWFLNRGRLLKVRDVKYARQIFQVGAKIDPSRQQEFAAKEAETYKRDGDEAARVGDWQTGLDLYKQAESIDQTNASTYRAAAAQLHFAWATKLVDDKDYDAAIEHFRAAIEHFRGAISLGGSPNAAWFSKIADCCVYLGQKAALNRNYHEAKRQFDEAIRQFDEAYKIEPDTDRRAAIRAKRALPFYEKAVLAFNELRYDEAATYFQMAAEADPSNTDPDYFYWLGRSLHYQKKHLEAIDAYTKSVNNKPDAKALAFLGDAHLEGNLSYRQARIHYEKALKLEQNFPSAHNGLALLLSNGYGSNGEDLRQALVHAQTACKDTNHQRYPEFLISLAWVHGKRQEFEKAKEILRQAETLPNADKTAIRLHLAAFDQQRTYSLPTPKQE